MKTKTNIAVGALMIMTCLSQVYAFQAPSASSDRFNRSDATPKPGWVRRTFSKLTWDEIATVVDSPKEACAVVRHNLRYQADVGEEWPGAEETWDRGYGDCEDYATCIAELCRKLGFEASVLVLYPEDGWEGHAIVTGKWNGKQWIASNGWYKSVDSLEDVKKYVAREMGWGRKRRVNTTTLASLIPGGRKVGRTKASMILP